MPTVGSCQAPGSNLAESMTEATVQGNAWQKERERVQATGYQSPTSPFLITCQFFRCSTRDVPLAVFWTLAPIILQELINSRTNSVLLGLFIPIKKDPRCY